MKLEITKEKVLKASETCPDAKEVLKELFPDVFEEQEKDITEEIKWKMCEFDDGYWLMGTYGENEEAQFYLNVAGLHFNHESHEEKFRFEIDDTSFRIFTKN